MVAAVVFVVVVSVAMMVVMIITDAIICILSTKYINPN